MTQRVKGVSIYKPRTRARARDPYLMTYKDPAQRNKRITLSGSTSLAVTVKAAEGIASRLDAARLGIGDLKADRYVREGAKSISEHLKDFGKMLAGKGDTAKHAKRSVALVTRILELSGVEQIAELNISSIHAGLALLADRRTRKSPTAHATLSKRTLDSAVRACKTFSKWLKKDSRSPDDALQFLTGFNPETDKRHRRRALSEEQVSALLESAETGNVRGGLSGIDRAMLYRVAIGTGYRRSELRSLTPESFHLTAIPPYVALTAGSAKNRKDYRQAIRDDLAAILKPWLANKPAGASVFAWKPHASVSLAIRRDLEAVGIDYRDKSGLVADFHSLRHAGITLVVRGAGLRIGQEWARHSTPLLTSRYSHLNASDFSRALDSLPAASPVRNKRKGVV